MRIAFFTPLSPLRSALADYGEGLAVGLTDLPGVTVDLFIGGDYQPDNPVITQRFKIYPHREFETRAKQYDVCLYSMGDHAGYHGYMLDFMRRFPGIVIMNDLTFHHCILHTAQTQNNIAMYLDELEHAYGLRTMRLAHQIQVGMGDFMILEYPLFEGLVDQSLGVIVQNHYARQRILAKRPQTRIACIPYPFFMPPGFPAVAMPESRQRQKAALGLEPEALIIGSFGIFVPNKHLESCLNAFAHLVRRYPRATYILGGFPAEGYDLKQHIRELGLTEHVILTGWQSPLNFARYMLALDIGIHLRYPHIGGTPYTPIRLMGLGINTIVSEIEPLAEVPEGVCIKISPDDYQEGTLTAMLDHLADDADFRQQLGQNAQQFIAQHHDLSRIAQSTLGFIQQVLAAQ